MSAPQKNSAAGLFDSPLRRRQRESARLEAHAAAMTRWFHRPLVFGIRGLAGPVMALQTDLNLGPVRHALSQMAIAGTVQWMPSFPPPAARRPSGGSAADVAAQDLNAVPEETVPQKS